MNDRGQYCNSTCKISVPDPSLFDIEDRGSIYGLRFMNTANFHKEPSLVNMKIIVEPD